MEETVQFESKTYEMNPYWHKWHETFHNYLYLMEVNHRRRQENKRVQTVFFWVILVLDLYLKTLND